MEEYPVFQARIYGNHSKAGLREILEVFQPRGSTWHILRLEGVGLLDEGQKMLDLEQSVSSNKLGLVLNEDQLFKLAAQIEDVNEITLVALSSAMDFAKSREQLIRNADLIIDLFDASYWTVTSKDKESVDDVIEAFTPSLRVEPQSPDLNMI